MVKDNGFIFLHRKFKEWEWYKNINVKTLFIHCLIMANFKDNKWQGIEIKRGSFITSIRNLSIETGLTDRQVRTALDKLVLTSELTNKSTNKYRTITVLKYNEYQTADKQEVKQVTIKRQTSDKPLTTTNKDNNLKKEKKVIKNTHLEFVKLTEDEHNKLKSKFNSKTDSLIENLNNYIGSTGKKYKSHYHTILSWERKNKDNKPEESIYDYLPKKED